MRQRITNATIVEDGERFKGSLLIEDGIIADIAREGNILPGWLSDPGIEETNAGGMLLLPGVIDDHVHNREPGLTHKADMDSETRAAAAGGVTSVFDMPNVVPQTTSLKLLEERYRMAGEKCHVNYAFYLGATADNIDDIRNIDTTRVPGIKLFMGSSTGNMLVDKEESLRAIFKACPGILMTHCEDTSRINRRIAEVQARYDGDYDNIRHHAEVRDHDACYDSTSLAVRLARETGCRLHVAHLSTARELSLFAPGDSQVTAEACVAHLLFCDEDYDTLGARIKCNPSVKGSIDRDALREACRDGRIRIIATDHAPHLLEEKRGGYLKAVSGMPMVQYSLPAVLTLCDEGAMTIERAVELMCHNPAELFGVDRRGHILPGYHADLVLLSHTKWTVTAGSVLSKCHWSPLEGRTLNWKVERTLVNGRCVWDGKRIDPSVYGECVRFKAF